MKKVVLIDPTFNSGKIPPNLGLGKIEAALAGYPIDVRLTDFVLPDSKELSLSAFRKLEAAFVESAVEAATGADAVYISGSHGIEMKPYAIFPRIRAVATTVKAVHPETKVLFGGALANFYVLIHKIDPGLFSEFGIDQVIVGQELNAASTILEACGMVEASALPSPRKEVVPQWNAWELGKYPNYLSAMIQTGCPYICNFCFEGKVFDPQSPKTAPEGVVEIVAGVRHRHPVDAVMIEDSIALSYSWIDELTAAMKGAGIDWALYARSNEIVERREKLKALREAGCRSMIVGIESFDDEDLRATNKRVTANQALRAIELCEQADIAVQGCLILGFPTDTVDRVESRIVLARNLGLSAYHWHILQPDWAKLPAGIRGMDDATIIDHFDAQVSAPDSCLPELVEEAPGMAIYDEHFLIRLIPGYNDVPRLEQFGYQNRFTLRELMAAAAPLIREIGLPTNEEEMYGILFDPPANVAA